MWPQTPPTGPPAGRILCLHDATGCARGGGRRPRVLGRAGAHRGALAQRGAPGAAGGWAHAPSAPYLCPPPPPHLWPPSTAAGWASAGGCASAAAAVPHSPTCAAAGGRPPGGRPTPSLSLPRRRRGGDSPTGASFPPPGAARNVAPGRWWPSLWGEVTPPPSGADTGCCGLAGKATALARKPGGEGGGGHNCGQEKMKKSAEPCNPCTPPQEHPPMATSSSPSTPPHNKWKRESHKY